MRKHFLIWCQDVRHLETWFSLLFGYKLSTRFFFATWHVRMLGHVGARLCRSVFWHTSLKRTRAVSMRLASFPWYLGIFLAPVAWLLISCFKRMIMRVPSSPHGVWQGRNMQKHAETCRNHYCGCLRTALIVLIVAQPCVNPSSRKVRSRAQSQRRCKPVMSLVGAKASDIAAAFWRSLSRLAGVGSVSD